MSLSTGINDYLISVGVHGTGVARQGSVDGQRTRSNKSRSSKDSAQTRGKGYE